MASLDVRLYVVVSCVVWHACLRGFKRFVELADEKGLVPLEYHDMVRPELPAFRRLNAALSGDAPVGWSANQAAEAQRCVWPAGCWATIPRHAYY